MAGYAVIRITERLGGGEPLRTAYAVAEEPNQHRAIALFKLRPDHTADEQVEAVVELSQSALDSLEAFGQDGDADCAGDDACSAAEAGDIFGYVFRRKQSRCIQ